MHHQLYLSLFLVVPTAVITCADSIARSFRAAMALVGINGKVAAHNAGLSESQLSRQLSGGTLSVAVVLAQGPEFRTHFHRLLDALSGSDAQPSEQRRSA